MKMESASLTVRHGYCGYGGQSIINDISFHIPQGRVACLLGPSGCGKTTLLRAIAGLEKLVSGEICLDAVCCASTDVHWPAEKRHVGVVFQDLALFPHLNVADNIAFGLFRLSTAERKRRIAHMLEMVGLNDFAKRMPHQLSGGQQQRVALARALAPRPRLILLDEPFTALDASLRIQLAEDVRQLLKAEHCTALLVTHDQQEAFRFADEIGVLLNGQLSQWDCARILYEQPVSREVATFIGDGSWLTGHWQADGRIECALGVVGAQSVATIGPVGQRVDILLRPEVVQMSAVHGEGNATIVDTTFIGSQTRHHLQLSTGERVTAQVPSHRAYETGDTVWVQLDVATVPAYPPSP